MKVTELKRLLNEKDYSELVKLLVDLYKDNKNVQNYIDSKLLGDGYEKELLENYKKKIESCFFPQRGFAKNPTKEGKLLINEFKKISKNDEYVVDLQLYYIECGVNFTNSFGDMPMPFYKALASALDDVVSRIYMSSNNIYDLFRKRIISIENNSESIAWGFGMYVGETISQLRCDFDDFDDFD